MSWCPVAVRGVQVDLRRTLAGSSGRSRGLRGRGRRQARRASGDTFAEADRFRRWVRSALLGGDQVRCEAGLERQRLFRVRDRIAGRRGWLRKRRHWSRRPIDCSIGLRGRRRTARYRGSADVLLRQRLLLTLALIGAQVLLQLLNLPLVHLCGHGQRAGWNIFRSGLGMVLREHDGHPILPPYCLLEAEAQQRLRGRDGEDRPVLAVALPLSCDIWTEDTDFFGTGVAVWTSDWVEIRQCG
jgi:hypothetical protein